ncbi:MAG: sensor histidine kinase [Bacteroidia bacterium]|nr:sensor histidine kinase [Bacteroidia bacterium]
MKNQKTSVFIILLSVLNAFLCAMVLVLWQWFANSSFDLALVLILFFAFFVTSFFVLYFIYNPFIFDKIKNVQTELSKILPHNEIPDTKFQLDEIDPITQLDLEVKKIAIERQKELEHLKNVDSYRKEYLGNVSHELKTPVFNIQGYVSTLIDGGLNDPSINLDYLKRADKSIERIIHIIDDLETITQLETGSLELEFEKYDFSAQCRDVFEQLDMLAKKKKITLTLAKKFDKPLTVLADKFRIRQVLVNLITNSIKYGKEGGETELSFNLYNDEVIVEIKDNGIGISPEHLPRLFERFYRVDKGRSREQGGTGLGLAIVKHIIEAHQKSISVKSTVNEGTVFTFTLSRV